MSNNNNNINLELNCFYYYKNKRVCYMGFVEGKGHEFFNAGWTEACSEIYLKDSELFLIIKDKI